MATACIAQSTLRVHGISKPIIAKFDQPQASSDGGAMLLKAVDDRLGLTWRLVSALRDRRQPGQADLYRLGTALADTERLGTGVRLITIDLDATDDPTHGQYTTL